MSSRSAPLFDAEGKGTPVLFGLLRSRMPVVPVQSRAVLVEQGMATRYFSDWWRTAYPARSPMPTDQIANRDGTGTDRLWSALR